MEICEALTVYELIRDKINDDIDFYDRSLIVERVWDDYLRSDFGNFLDFEAQYEYKEIV